MFGLLVLALACIGGCRTPSVTLFGDSAHSLCVQGPGLPLTCYYIAPVAGVEPGVPDVWLESYAGGVGGSCGLGASGVASCWGTTDHEIDVPAGRWASIALGSSHGCGFRPDGAQECWGTDFYGETIVPEERFAALVPVDHYTCGLRPDGSVRCWGGKREKDWRGPPEDVALVELYGRTLTLCGLDADRRLHCWGRDRGTLLSPPEDPGVRKVSVGVKHACAVMDDFALRCWGEDNYDLLTDVPSGTWADVTCGQYWTCALASDRRTVHCWGSVDDRRVDFRADEPPAGPGRDDG